MPDGDIAVVYRRIVPARQRDDLRGQGHREALRMPQRLHRSVRAVNADHDRPDVPDFVHR